MPLQINEVIIKAYIGDDEVHGARDAEETAHDREALIKECVEQVLEILREKSEK